MGFREVLLSGFVLLLSGGHVCVATQKWSNTIETVNQTPQEPQTADHQSDLTEHVDPELSPVTYRLKIHQLRNSAASKPPQPLSPNQQSSGATELTPEQLEPEVPEPVEEVVELPFKGPDLNPAFRPRSKGRALVIKQRVPVPADSIAARCGEGEVTVEVKQNFLGNGQLIRPSDLTLGGCAAVDAAHHILHFQTELQDCGSTVTITEHALIYSFYLLYSPTPISNTFILKTNPAKVVIECHYQRRHRVSSAAVRPTWTLFSGAVLAEQQLHLSLRLMTEDWQSQRPSSVHILSDMMHIEAAVLQGHHIPLRVYVDNCVATATPDPNSQPSYPFISNHGCLSDIEPAGATSYFMQRSQEDKLNFQLKAFKLDHRNSLYITCLMKATKVSVPIDSQHKACSYLTEANRWMASGGDNKVCGCCESSCSEPRWKRSLAADAGLVQWEGGVALGPVLLQENILTQKLTALQVHEVTGAASYTSLALLCGVGAALAVVLLLLMGAIICSRQNKPSGHFVST
ncbi:zona pellucida sperm-binding protein 3-like [Gymnodraco acuticeps]|uniref:Zona pellucida sperm-binding protein 3 n=1 Tax=Gymnodraco acuticeps TaxID=8218 RepID=A0A6P8U8X6_GYMAC|nr:zona pellucida sperm-binding protein 3-like [Gymnodraco acuticeps]